MSTDDTTPVPDPKAGDPSVRGGLAGLITAAVLFLAARYALPVDQETADLVGGTLAVLLGPLVATLVTRLKAWKPETVAQMREELLTRVRQASLASKTGETRTEAVGTEDGQPGRHIRYNTEEG